MVSCCCICSSIFVFLSTVLRAGSAAVFCVGVNAFGWALGIVVLHLLGFYHGLGMICGLTYTDEAEQRETADETFFRTKSRDDRRWLSVEERSRVRARSYIIV